jgi:hypothetical protein
MRRGRPVAPFVLTFGCFVVTVVVAPCSVRTASSISYCAHGTGH